MITDYLIKNLTGSDEDSFMQSLGTASSASGASSFMETLGTPPSKWYSSLASQTDEDFQERLEYLWENHSNSFNLAKKYRIIHSYERTNHKDSEELFKEWINGELKDRDIFINDWLLTYMQIKKFIK